MFRFAMLRMVVLAALLFSGQLTAATFHPVLQLNMLGTNGEEFMTVNKIFDDGSTEEVTVGAGGMVYFAGGFSVANYLNIGPGHFQTEILYGYQGASTTGGTDAVSFTRTSVQALQFYRIPFGNELPAGGRMLLRVGGGVNYDMGVKAKYDIAPTLINYEFENALGYIAQVDVVVPTKSKWMDYVYVGGMYKMIDYSLKSGFSNLPNGNTSINGSYLAFTSGVGF